MNNFNSVCPSGNTMIDCDPRENETRSERHNREASEMIPVDILPYDNALAAIQRKILSAFRKQDFRKLAQWTLRKVAVIERCDRERARNGY